MHRLLLALVAATVLLVPGTSPAAAHGPRTWWAVAYPFASPPAEAIAWNQVRGQRRNVDLPVGAGSLYQVRGLRWSGWGTARATGAGRVRYCDDTCLGWRTAKIVLGSARTIDCQDGLDPGHDVHRVYMRTTISGFEFEPDGRVLRASTDALRC